MKRLVLVLVLCAWPLLRGQAQDHPEQLVPEPLFSDAPTLLEEDAPEPEARRSLPDLGFGVSAGGGQSRFLGQGRETFGNAGHFFFDGNLFFSRWMAGFGLSLGEGVILEDYDFQGLWPKGESYVNNQLYLRGGWSVVDGKRLRVTPFIGAGQRMLNYEYYHGANDEDGEDPSLYYTRRGRCYMAGLEACLNLSGDATEPISLLGRVYVTRAGFPGISGDSWAIHFAIGLDFITYPFR